MIKHDIAPTLVGIFFFEQFLVIVQARLHAKVSSFFPLRLLAIDNGSQLAGFSPSLSSSSSNSRSLIKHDFTTKSVGFFFVFLAQFLAIDDDLKPKLAGFFFFFDTVFCPCSMFIYIIIYSFILNMDLSMVSLC